MITIDKIKADAERLIIRGAPYTKDELAIIKMGTPFKANAGNSGKRTKKNHNKNW